MKEESSDNGKKGSMTRGARPPSFTLWHKFFFWFARHVALKHFKKKLDLHTEPCTKEMDLPCFAVYNHVSDYDFFATADMFRPYCRYVASDAIIRGNKRFIVPITCDFIYRRKGERADEVVESAMITIDRGISVALAAEGEESPNGETMAVRAKTGKMIKDAGCGLVTMRLTGGYFIKPSWSRNDAKGPSYGEVIGIYTKEQVAAMSVEEINETIYHDIYVNHYRWNKIERHVYERECRAEWMERTLYICPKCKKVCSMKSEVNDLFCTDCGYRVSVDECGFFVGGDDMVFDNLYDWEIWQRELLRSKRPEWLANPDEVITSADHLLLKVTKNDKKVIIDDDVHVEMTARKLTVTGKNIELVMPMDDIVSIVKAWSDDVAISYNGTYYILETPNHVGTRRYRTIFKILKGQDDI